MAFECVYFSLVLQSPQRVCWALSHIMCQMFSVCVPAIQNSVSVARSVGSYCRNGVSHSAAGLRTEFTVVFHQFHKCFVYIVYMMSFIPKWVPLGTVDIKLNFIIGVLLFKIGNYQYLSIDLFLLWTAVLLFVSVCKFRFYRKIDL